MLDTTRAAEGSPRNKPGDCDVVCGRSTLARSHPGNRRFRALIQKAGDAYQNAKSRKAKKGITTDIIQAIFRLGGEFLKVTRESNSNDSAKYRLEVATEDFIYEKVSHALRSYRPSTTAAAHICCCNARNHQHNRNHHEDQSISSHSDELDFIVDNVSWVDSDSVCLPLPTVRLPQSMVPIRTVSYKDVIENNVVTVCPSPTSSDDSALTLDEPLSSHGDSQSRETNVLTDNILNEPLELDSFQWEEDPSVFNLDIFEL